MSHLNHPEKLHVLIPSAGTGTRFGGDLPKQFQILNGQAVIFQVLEIFLGMPEIDSIWIGLSKDYLETSLFQHPKIKAALTGGETRASTVLNTLEHMLKNQVSENDWVLVHDAARPGIRLETIRVLIERVISQDHCGGIVALPVADTLKKENGHTQIEKTISREGLWQAQTPQMFRVGPLRNALQQALSQDLQITDEASAMEQMGFNPLLIKGTLDNFKITYPEDLNMMAKLTQPSINFRVGQGYDVHRLVLGRDLILGGVKIEYEKGLDGHSDADALLHAITDALIGAAALGDIGRHFPDTDQNFKNADSSVLLKKTLELIKEQGFRVINIDSTIICQSPKLAKYVPLMISKIAQILEIDPKNINVKAKTNEGLGYLGTSEAIETQAIVLVSQ